MERQVKRNKFFVIFCLLSIVVLSEIQFNILTNFPFAIYTESFHYIDFFKFIYKLKDKQFNTFKLIWAINGCRDRNVDSPSYNQPVQ